MVFQNAAGALGPSQGEPAGCHQGPAGCIAPELLSGQIRGSFRAGGVQVPDASGGMEPKGQGMGGQKPAVAALPQLQPRAQNPQTGEVRQLLRRPKPICAKVQGVSRR